MTESSVLDLLAKLSGDLESEGIVHALTGSIASGLHGEPVTSLDVDVVVTMTPDRAAMMARKWAQDLLADEESFRRAAAECGIVNLLHFRTGLKIDISVLPDTPYYREVLRRRVGFTVPGGSQTFWIVSPEDIILMKLEWRKETQSAKQWENALSVVRVQGTKLDWAYMRHWAQELGVPGDLEALAEQGGV